MDGARAYTLTEDEAHSRIGSYESPGTTDVLLAFGGRLLDANRDRTKHLESKAVMIVGYALGVLGVVLFQGQSASGVGLYLVRMAAFLAAAALLASFLAFRVRAYQWLSDAQWFENECGVLEDPDGLKRSHVLAFHAANAKIGESNDRKADMVILAQAAVVWAGLCVAGWALLR